MFKGSVQDIMFVSVVIILSAMGILIGYTIMDNIVKQGDDSQINTTIATTGRTAINTFNTSFIIMIGLFFVGILVLAWSINISRPMFVIALIVFIFIIFISLQFSNVFENFITDTPMSDAADDFNYLVAAMRNLPLILGGLGSIVMLVLFGKIRQDQGG